MILPFSTQINGKPSYFVERIHSGLIINDLWPEAFDADFAHKGFSMDAFAEKDAKIHTIREDKNNRWKVGAKVDFFINSRQKNMFRFAPVLPVVSIQKIEITWVSEVRSVELSKLNSKRLNYVDVIIDGILLCIQDIKELAQNDGFDTVEEFFAYFNEDFTGKLIHWTNKRY